MPGSVEKTVGEIAADFPVAPKVLEMHHIDYSTGGKRPFREACRVAGVAAEEILNEINKASSRADGEENWKAHPTANLIEYLIAMHQRWSNENVPLIEALLERVEAEPNLATSLPSVTRIRRLFTRMRHELVQHLRKEENVLFPAILKLERSAASRTPAPREPFGSFVNPIALMESDHDADARIWDELRDLTYGYAAPEDAPESVRLLFRELGKLAVAIHEHTHLENNILFPRVVNLERRLRECRTGS
jgi:regulator of cell morphogenesis and NO signaling